MSRLLALVLLALSVACSSITPPASRVGVLQSDGRRAVLVTGASSGLGLQMAKTLAANGFHVYAGARKDADIKMLNALEHVQGVRLDVNKSDEIEAAVKLVEGSGRGLFGLINNAGVAVVGPLIEMSEEDMAFQMDVNLFGPYRVTKAFAPLLIESKGRIVTTGSISGLLSPPLLGAYSMSKHAVEAFSDALAGELARFGLSVGVIEPGNYKSDIVSSLQARMDASGYDAKDSLYAEQMAQLFQGPSDRSQHKSPEDVANAALHFMTSDSPKHRYMVVPNEFEAQITIGQVVRELVELNHDQPFEFDRDALVAMLDAALVKIAE